MSVDDPRAEEKGCRQTPWMKTAEAAAYVRCSARTLEGYRLNGGGPFYYRQGARIVFYHQDDLDAWRRGQGAMRHTAAERLAGVSLAGLRAGRD